MSYQVKVEKVIGRSISDVFRALKEGKLFMNCSADSRSMEIDFRVGGKYHIDFWSHGKYNFGEFLEIIPDRKIVFSWCQDFAPDRKPDTEVTIELFPEASKTRLVLIHTGFKNQEIFEAHQNGWTHGINDFIDELQHDRLRMVRMFPSSVDELFEMCASPPTFFAIMGDFAKGTVDFRAGGKYQLPTRSGEIKGEFLEIIPNQKITFSWLVGCDGPLTGSRVTMTFGASDRGGSKVELIHEGLHTESEQMAHRRGWEVVTKTMLERLSKKEKAA